MVLVLEIVSQGHDIGVVGHGTVKDPRLADPFQLECVESGFGVDFDCYFLSLERVTRTIRFVVGGTVDDSVGTRLQLVDAMVTAIVKDTASEVKVGDTAGSDRFN